MVGFRSARLRACDGPRRVSARGSVGTGAGRDEARAARLPERRSRRCGRGHRAAELVEAAVVIAHELGEPAVARSRQQDPHPSRVRLVATPADEARGGAAVDQADRALVPHLQALGERGDRRAVGIEAAHEQQELVLTRGDVRLARGALRLPEEASQRVPKLRELLVVVIPEARSPGARPPRVRRGPPRADGAAPRSGARARAPSFSHPFGYTESREAFGKAGRDFSRRQISLESGIFAGRAEPQPAATHRPAAQDRRAPIDSARSTESGLVERIVTRIALVSSGKRPDLAS